MYEDNNNYTYTSNYSPEPEPKKRGAGKILAMILALVLVGGASGFGGAYLANNMSSEETSAAENESSGGESSETIQTVTAAPQNVNESIIRYRDQDISLNSLMTVCHTTTAETALSMT